MRNYLPVLLDQTTVVSDAVIRGRVNVNSASRTVLRAVPGMEDYLVEAILSKPPHRRRRSRAPAPDLALDRGTC